MLSRSELWFRVASPGGWALAWALIPACALPWLLPEGWEGRVPGWGVWGGALLVLGVAPLLRSRRWAVVPLALALLWGTLGRLSGEARWRKDLPVGLQAFEGRVAEPWALERDRWRSEVAVEAGPWKGCHLSLDLPGDSEGPRPAPGTPVRFRAEPRTVDPAPVFLAERPWWRALSERAPARIHLPSATLLEPLGPPEPGLALRLRTFARARFDALDLPPLARDLWGALALGISPVREDSFAPFAESGTLHVLVVSGLQVSLVMALAAFLAGRLLGRGTLPAALMAGLGFSLMVGFSAPVWRGLLMGAALALGQGRGWRLPPVWGLHLALLMWLLGHPAAGADPGFLLSWFALLGLLWGAEPLAGLASPLLGRWALPLARLVAPWAATLPLLALFHGGAPAWGVAANLLVLPVAGLLTPLCLLLTFLPWGPGVHGVGLFLEWVGHRLVPFFASVRPLGTGILAPWIALVLGWVLLAWGHATLRRTRALSFTLLTATLLMLASGGTGRAPSSLSLEGVDVGQGDALLVRVPGGEALVVDAGPTPWAARRLARVLSRRGVREPLRLLATHPHGDHAGGLATFLRLRPVAGIWGPALEDAAEAWSPWISTPPEELRRGDGWRDGTADCAVRWPSKPYRLADANGVSLVLRLRWQDRELWLMGDALALQEQDLLELGDPGVSSFHRLLKVGHHGSRSSTSAPWAAALGPEVALIPAGKANRFGHPHAETLETLGAIPVEVVGRRRGLRIEAMAGGWRVEGGDGISRTVPTRGPN